MAVSANTLFHFTSEKENLEGILKNFFYPKYHEEDLSKVNLKGKLITAYVPMVCFCDLLLSQLDEHFKFYGEYGIGLTKEWGQDKGISPIIYVPENSNSSHLIHKIGMQFQDLMKSVSKEEYDGKSVPDFFKYIKPYDGTTKSRVKDALEYKVFYNEREWRFCPENNSIIAASKGIAKFILEENEKLKIGKRLTFGPQHVKYIIVKREDEIPKWAKFIDVELKSVFKSSDDRRLLVSKLISAKQITDDM